LGFAMFVFGYTQLFPSKINEAPELDGKDGYIDNMASGHLEQAEMKLMKAVTRIDYWHYLPVVGQYNPLGNVKNSKYRIEEDGAKAYFRKMYILARDAEDEIKDVDMDWTKNPQKQLKSMDGGVKRYKHAIAAFNFIDGLVQDAVDYSSEVKPVSPAEARLFLLKLAFLKHLKMFKECPRIAAYASEASIVLGPLIKEVPELNTEYDIDNFINGINTDEIIGESDIYGDYLKSETPPLQFNESK